VDAGSGASFLFFGFGEYSTHKLENVDSMEKNVQFKMGFAILIKESFQ
jgi:hypothetical protein